MTKKKKGAILISALALIAVIVIGGTLAYFTDQDDAKNVFTLGKVQGDLTEDTKDYEVDTPGGGTHPVKPGDVYKRQGENIEGGDTPLGQPDEETIDPNETPLANAAKQVGGMANLIMIGVGGVALLAVLITAIIVYRKKKARQ